MYQVFNTKLLTNKQRFYQGLLFGFLASVGCAIAYALFVELFHISFSILFLAFGYAISTVIQKFGRGVQQKYSIMGAIFTTFSLILAQMFVLNPYGIGIILHPDLYVPVLELIFTQYSSLSTNSILSLAFQAFSIYIAYVNSRIV